LAEFEERSPWRPKSSNHPSPSQQTQQILEATTVEGAKDDKRWEKMQESIDLLFSKLEMQDVVQQQLGVQMASRTSLNPPKISDN
jgi:hypothetical protein